MKVIFSCLNLKPYDGFLPYNMSKVFNKTGHGLTVIEIAGDEFKPVFLTEYFWECILYARVKLKALSWGLCQKFFRSLE